MNHRTVLLLLMLLIALLPIDGYAQKNDPDPRFGIVQTFDDFEAADELGVGFTRVKFYWDVIQPNGPNEWQPANIPDPLIAADLAAGREVVGLIVRTPAWARDLDHPRNNPAEPTAKDVPDMTAWAAFTRKLAEQYRGRIHHWVIWNEPDVWDSQHPGSTWNGSVRDFVELQKTAYLSLKAANPQAQIYLPGLTYFWDYEAKQEQYLSRLLTVLTADPQAAQHHHYFDGLVYHLYYKPQMIYDMLADIQTMLDVHGLSDKRIWLNETNAAPSQDSLEPPHFRELPFEATLSEQAAFMIQIHAMAFAADVERIQIYKLLNSSDHPEDVRPFGLIRGDDSRRPAFQAYQTAIASMSGFRQVELFQQDGVTVVLFDRVDSTTTILWNWATTPVQVTLKARATTAKQLDEIGQTTSLTPQDGFYQLELPAAECSGGDCFIGGAPRLIIEDVPPTTSLEFSVNRPSPTEPAVAPTGLADLFASRRRLVAVGFAISVMVGLVGLAAFVKITA